MDGCGEEIQAGMTIRHAINESNLSEEGQCPFIAEKTWKQDFSRETQINLRTSKNRYEYFV